MATFKYRSNINHGQGSAAIGNLSWGLDKMIMKNKEKNMIMIMMIMMISVYTYHTLFTDDSPIGRTVFWLVRTIDSYVLSNLVSLSNR
jgi:hypothetical protein